MLLMSQDSRKQTFLCHQGRKFDWLIEREGPDSSLYDS